MSAQALVNDPLPNSVPSAGTILAETYRVDGVLATGGMGIILRATELACERQVAIKVMTTAAASDPEAVARFRREAKAASSLTSKHVVRVLDFGELESGLPYLVMEHLGGTPLVDLVKVRGPLPIGEAVDYVLEAIHGIAEAHALGIIHRDLKPANLFLADNGAAPIVKVLDFGASKLTAESSIDPNDGGVTVATSLIGSPRYMAPEQIRSALEVDARADIYALGATLHELLSGKPIFAADTLARIFAQVLWDEPEALSSTRDDVPDGLAAVVSRCLAKSPDDRYATVEALAVALAPFGSSHAGETQQPRAPLPKPVAPPKPAAVSGAKLVAARLFRPAEAESEKGKSAARDADDTHVDDTHADAKAPVMAPAAEAKSAVVAAVRKSRMPSSASRAGVVIERTQRMPRARMATEPPKRTMKLAAFALAARLSPSVGAVKTGELATEPVRERPIAARTVRMARFVPSEPMASPGPLSGLPRVPRAVAIAVAVAFVLALVAAIAGTSLARRSAHARSAASHAAHGGE